MQTNDWLQLGLFIGLVGLIRECRHSSHLSTSLRMIALIVVDEIQIRRLLRMALESRGYTVKEAENGRLGLQEAALHRPDVVLLDLDLPDMTGWKYSRRCVNGAKCPS